VSGERRGEVRVPDAPGHVAVGVDGPNENGIARKDVILVLLLPTPGLAELIVRESLAGSGDVRMNAIEHDSARHVLVEPLVEEIAQKAAALRDSERDSDVREAL
jgi:hypothetical protein